MDTIKVYVVGKEKAELICPSCSKATVICIADTDISKNCEIECICKTTFLVIFEKRKSFRGRVLLTGTCFSKSDSTEGKTVKIVNLSRTGMLFLKDTGEKPELNETIRLRFRPKVSNNVIRCTALVRNIDGDSIGAQFLNLNLDAQKLIGSCVLA